jgi:hypothetical protein
MASNAQFSGQTVADEQASSRHDDVPQAEDRGHFQSAQPVHAADPDGDCRPKLFRPSARATISSATMIANHLPNE